MNINPLLIAALASMTLAAGPATKPTTARAPIAPTGAAAAPVAVSRELYTQAVAAYRAADFAGAIDLAEKQQRELLRAKTKPTDPAVIEAAHLQAVALMKLGQYQKADAVFTKTYPAMAGNRTLVYNVALCDVVGKTYAIRAAKNLQSYATAHHDDEQIVNLWGCAIDVASSEGKNPGKMADFATAYAKVDAMLAATRPGMKRWGTEWMSAAEFAPIEEKRAEQKRQVDQTRSARDLAVSKYESAVAAYKRASAPVPGGAVRRSHDWYNDHCYECLQRERRYRMESAQREVDHRRPIAESAVAAYDRAVAEMPKPTWAMSMEPIDPFE